MGLKNRNDFILLNCLSTAKAIHTYLVRLRQPNSAAAESMKMLLALSVERTKEFIKNRVNIENASTGKR